MAPIIQASLVFRSFSLTFIFPGHAGSPENVVSGWALASLFLKLAMITFPFILIKSFLATTLDVNPVFSGVCWWSRYTGKAWVAAVKYWSEGNYSAQKTCESSWQGFAWISSPYRHTHRCYQTGHKRRHESNWRAVMIDDDHGAAPVLLIAV